MILLVLLAVAFLSVPLAGGRLGAFAELRFNGLPVLVGALGIQIAILNVVPEGEPALHRAVHVATYVAGGYVVLRNRHIPGLWLIGLGGLANFAAILANGGVMPALPAAAEKAGLETTPGFNNSAATADAPLWFLGDVFAVPASWPLANVFSAGDVAIALGTFVLAHLVCGSRLAPAQHGELAALRRNRSFSRLWLAQAVSGLGDWVYALAAVTVAASRGDGEQAVALLLAMQLGPSAIVGLLGGPLVDRRSRRGLMVGADLVRAAAVASLLLVPGEVAVAHLWGVAVVLGAAGALFGPSLHAALPDLVPERRLVAANAALSAAFTMAVTVGPLLGGFLVAQFGARAAFAVDAASFVLSAALVVSARVPAGAGEAVQRTTTVVRDLVAGLREVAATPPVRMLLVVLGLLMFGAALRAPLEPLLVLHTLDGAPEALGLVGAAWGVGMLVGSALATSAGRGGPERMLAVALGVAGATIAAAALVPSVGWLAGLWVLAGVANACGGIAHDTLLQTRAPAGARGRTLAAAEAVLDLAYLAGVVLAGTLAAGAGPRAGLAASGVVLLAAAVAAAVGLRPQPALRRRAVPVSAG